MDSDELEDHDEIRERFRRIPLAPKRQFLIAQIVDENSKPLSKIVHSEFHNLPIELNLAGYPLLFGQKPAPPAPKMPSRRETSLMATGLIAAIFGVLVMGAYVIFIEQKKSTDVPSPTLKIENAQEDTP